MTNVNKSVPNTCSMNYTKDCPVDQPDEIDEDKKYLARFVGWQIWRNSLPLAKVFGEDVIHSETQRYPKFEIYFVDV